MLQVSSGTKQQPVATALQLLAIWLEYKPHHYHIFRGFQKKPKCQILQGIFQCMNINDDSLDVFKIFHVFSDRMAFWLAHLISTNRDKLRLWQASVPCSIPQALPESQKEELCFVCPKRFHKACSPLSILHCIVLPTEDFIQIQIMFWQGVLYSQLC